MGQHNHAPKLFVTETPGAGQALTRLLRSPALMVIIILALATLGCNFLTSTAPPALRPGPTRTPWPTFTPTPAAVAPAWAPATAAPLASLPATPPAPPGDNPVAVVITPAAPTPSPTLVDASTPAVAPTPAGLAPPAPTDTPPPPTSTEAPAAPTPTLTPSEPVAPDAAPPEIPTPDMSGWSFAGVRVYDDQYEGGLLVCGDLVNQTGSTQDIYFISGTFYDAQGQVVADETSAYGYVPVYLLPPGGRTPFEMTVEGLQSAADFDLWVEFEPSSSQAPRQDFEFSEVYELDEGYGYCIGGTLRNPGGELGDYLLVVATLYDAQERVISFGEYYAAADYVVGDQTEAFEVCVDPRNQQVARYELRAWGQ